MNKDEQQYLNLLQKVLDEGEERKDRTGTGTLALFGQTLRFDLRQNTMPLLTTKKVFWKGVVEELLFFINGKTKTKELEDKGVNIWKGNTSKEFLEKRGFRVKDYRHGEMGPMYGFNWRKFGERTIEGEDGFTEYGAHENVVHQPGIDQLQNVFDSLKNDPFSRRHLVIATDPHAADKRVLDECHYAFQFYVSNDKELSLIFNMRSSDLFLGVPFNIASYALLTHLMASALGYSAKEVVFNGGDVHLYLNHIEQSKLQLSRIPNDFPKLKINKILSSLQDIEKLKMEDIELIDYHSHPAIKAEMSV